MSYASFRAMFDLLEDDDVSGKPENSLRMLRPLMDAVLARKAKNELAGWDGPGVDEDESVELENLRIDKNIVHAGRMNDTKGASSGLFIHVDGFLGSDFEDEDDDEDGVGDSDEEEEEEEEEEEKGDEDVAAPYCRDRQAWEKEAIVERVTTDNDGVEEAFDGVGDDDLDLELPGVDLKADDAARLGRYASDAGAFFAELRALRAREEAEGTKKGPHGRGEAELTAETDRKSPEEESRERATDE
jgi:hypothetical protein